MFVRNDMRFSALQTDIPRPNHSAHADSLVQALCHVWKSTARAIVETARQKKEGTKYLPVVQHDAVRVAALGVHPVLAPVLAVVRKDQSWAVLVISHVAQLTLTAGSHQAPHTCIYIFSVIFN